jgi:AcrR family transcriptional regulator
MIATFNRPQRHSMVADETQPDITLSRREANKRSKRQRLLHASLRLFREKGFENTTVAEITAAAGVAKGTFFNYFPTKEDVLLALGEQTLGKLQLNFQAVSGRESTCGKIKAIFAALAAGLDADRELVREMVYRGLRLPDLVDRQRARLDFRATLVLLLNHGQRLGEVRRDVDIYFVADVLYTLYFQQVVTWCSNDFRTSLPDQLNQMVDLVFAGIRSS